jgi:hypothetical protein
MSWDVWWGGSSWDSSGGFLLLTPLGVSVMGRPSVQGHLGPSRAIQGRQGPSRAI